MASTPLVPATKAEEDEENIDERFNLKDVIDKRILDSRTLLLADEIYMNACRDAVRKLLYISKNGTAPIHVIINSPGGEVYAGLLLYDTIRDIVRTGIEVVVEARGLVASMGTIILQSGSKRIASAHTRFMIHEIFSVSWGKASEQAEQVAELEKLNYLLREILATKTGKSVDAIEAMWKKTDVWFSAKEAKEFGLIDEIIE